MNDLDIPILNKSFELYKTFHDYRKVVPKTERFTIYERSENLILEVIELLIEAGYLPRTNKVGILEQASVKLNTLRLLIRLMKESQTFDTKKYVTLQEIIDDIGRQLGGWIRSPSVGR
jgi:hypothetical protein